MVAHVARLVPRPLPHRSGKKGTGLGICSDDAQRVPGVGHCNEQCAGREGDARVEGTASQQRAESIGQATNHGSTVAHGSVWNRVFSELNGRKLSSTARIYPRHHLLPSELRPLPQTTGVRWMDDAAACSTQPPRRLGAALG